MIDVMTTALALHDIGLCVRPLRTDGSKHPIGAWTEYQHHRPAREQLAVEAGRTDGLGLICGQISGNLEMFELEGRAVIEGYLEQLTKLLDDNGLSHILANLTQGYLEQTPSGGLHWLFHVNGAPALRNTALAARPSTLAELTANPETKVQRLIETRGEGGFVVVAPSAGRSHPSGLPWRLLHGSVETIPTISADDRDALYAIARMLDETGADPHDDEKPYVSRTTQPGSGPRPGDDYNLRARWEDILEPHGWRKTDKYGRSQLWRRPGKDHGSSATTSYNEHDRLYVFSTSTDFDAEKPYSKFAAHALLEHHKDFKAAATALAAAGYGTPPAEPPRLPTFTVVGEPITYTRTDDGNALRLIDTHKDVVRFCAQRDQWLTWDGRRWVTDISGVIREHARVLARNLPSEEKIDQRHRTWSLSARGLDAMLRVARSDDRIRINLNDLDAQPYQLNTPAGIVNLRDGTLTPPDPAALHTRITATSPNPDTAPTRWLAFLAETFAGDPDMTRYVQRLLGLSLIGTVVDPVLPFCHGVGANGKTTLLSVVTEILGVGDSGYAQPAPAEMLLARTTTSHPTELAHLSGARLVVASELEDGQHFAEARIKQLTGKDLIAARFMGKDFFTFRPTHTIWLLANEQPSVRVGGLAFWRRLRLIPFLHVVPPEKQQHDLDQRLVTDEGGAILAWTVQGAVDFIAHGPAEPAAVRAATDTYAHDQDTVSRFLEDRCITGDLNRPDLRVRVSDLRSAYETWCRTEGEQPIGTKTFTQALITRHGIAKERDRSSRYYLGVGLNEVSQDEAQDGPSVTPDPPPWWHK